MKIKDNRKSASENSFETENERTGFSEALFYAGNGSESGNLEADYDKNRKS